MRMDCIILKWWLEKIYEASWLRSSRTFGHLAQIFNVIVYASHGCVKKFLSTMNLANSRMTPSTSRNHSSFMIKLTETHVMHVKCYVTIPQKFVKSNGIDEKSNMVLITPYENSWYVKLGT